MTPETYARHDAIGLAALIREGGVPWQAVNEAAINAIRVLNPELNVLVIDDTERAMSAGPGARSGAALYGAPFLLKDVNQFTAFMPTTFSSTFFKDARPKQDGTLIRRWREAGLVILGKANTPEFAEDFVTEPTFRGSTLNPWDKNVTVGGSSGGAGAAVASGIVPMAHGTDLGGSIRIPAACCGVYGLKPSAGLNPVGPYLPEIASGLNSDHVLSRSVRDSAAALDAGSGPDIGQRYPVQRSADSYLDAMEETASGLRIGLATQAPDGVPVDDEMAEAAERLAKRLEVMGHAIVPYTLPDGLLSGDWFDLLWMFDISREIKDHAAVIGRDPHDDELEAFTRYLLKRTAASSGQEYYDARRALHDSSVILDRSMEGLDLIVTPALAADPVPVGAIDSRSKDFDYDTWATAGYGFAPFATPFNITGQPAASLPVETSKAGLPLGVQIAAQRGMDHLLLSISAQLELATGWRDNRPPIWAGNL